MAWAAGFIDGEGWFGVHTVDDRLYSRLQIAQAAWNREVLDRMVFIFGIGKVRGPYKHKGKRAHWSPCCMFAASSFEEVQAIGAMVWPWLGTAKRKQLKDMIGKIRAQGLPRRLSQAA